MVVTLDNFDEYIHTYEEDEIIYRNLYTLEREDPEAVEAYLNSLDPELIRKHDLYIPKLRSEPWYSYLKEQQAFISRPGSVVCLKHYRYTPVFDHEHEFVEILCMYDGTAEVSIQGIRHMLTTGDILIVPPGTTHSIGIFDDSIAFNIIVRNSNFKSIFFPMIADNSALSGFFSHVLFTKTYGNFILFHTGEDEEIRDTLRRIFVEHLGRGSYKTTFMNTYLSLLFVQLLRGYENHIESVLSKNDSKDTTVEILDYLNRNYSSITLTEAAEHFGFSSSRFSTVIKESTGRTFVQIIKEIKLSKACRALEETELSIADICELVGYENPEHFMRTFKKTYGMTPGQYRKEKKTQ